MNKILLSLCFSLTVLISNGQLLDELDQNITKHNFDFSPLKLKKQSIAKKTQGLKANGDGDPCNANVITFPYCPAGFPEDNTGSTGGFPAGTFQANSCGNTNQNEIYFRFVATENTIDVVVNNGTMNGSGAEITLLQTGPDDTDCTDLYTFLEASCSAFGTTNTFLEALTVGETYYLSVDSRNTANAGTFNLCINSYNYVPPAGSGGNCASAINVILPFSHIGNTLSTQLDNWSNSCIFGDGIGLYDTWYEYTSTGDEYVSISLSNISPMLMGFPSTFSGFPVLAEDYYSNVNVTFGCPTGTYLSECLYGGDPTINTDQNSTGTGYARFQQILGTDYSTDLTCKTMYLENPGTYYFMVEGYQTAYLDRPGMANDGWYVIGTELNSYTLNISSIAQASNDKCIGADNLFLNNAQSGNNSGCNYSWGADDPSSYQMCAISTENTAWFEFTTSAISTTVDIDFLNVAGDIQWGVVEGPCGGPYTSAGVNTSNPGVDGSGTPQDPSIAGTGTTGIGLSAAGDPCYRDNTDHTITITGLSPNTQYWVVVDGNAGALSSFDVSVIGGITLSSNTITLKGNQALEGNQLQWLVNSKVKGGKFIIERSEGLEFYEIGNVKGNNNNINYSNFTFLDENPKNILSHYRIKHISEKNEILYSDIIKINRSEYDYKLNSIYSEGNTVSINMNSSREESADVKIYDMSGKVIYNQSINLNKGSNSILLNSDINKATYLLFITNEKGERVYRKFVK